MKGFLIILFSLQNDLSADNPPSSGMVLIWAKALEYHKCPSFPFMVSSNALLVPFGSAASIFFGIKN